MKKRFLSSPKMHDIKVAIKQWKIVADYRLKSYNDRVDESVFQTAIKTFRI